MNLKNEILEKYYDGLTYDEIAQDLGTSKSNVQRIVQQEKHAQDKNRELIQQVNGIKASLAGIQEQIDGIEMNDEDYRNPFKKHLMDLARKFLIVKADPEALADLTEEVEELLEEVPFESEFRSEIELLHIFKYQLTYFQERMENAGFFSSCPVDAFKEKFPEFLKEYIQLITGLEDVEPEVE